MEKRNLGQYFTKKQHWLKPHIKNFILSSKCKKMIDPFAGEGDLLRVGKELGFKETIGLDIDPKLGWTLNDSLDKVPKHEDGIVLTNPPYLSKNSARKRRLEAYKYFLNNDFQDLYQVAIDRVLRSVDCAVFIVPETFLRSSLFTEHLCSLTVIEEDLFDDTECPVCVCCFKKNFKKPYSIFKNGCFVFDSTEAESILKEFDSNMNVSINFNAKNGNLGLRGVDGTKNEDKINFCLPEELNYDSSRIKISSRAITILNVDLNIDETFLLVSNFVLNQYRNKTHDVFLAPFKNNNKDGIRRRRLDFQLARKIINKTAELLD
jgi:hypothetical protein